MCAFQFWRSREPIRRLQLGRDGERTVGELLESLRTHGAHVFHDVPGDHFNLDHVLLCRRGIFVIETKTRSKPAAGDARVTLKADSVLVGGQRPDRDPVRQVEAGARWLGELLAQSTGQHFPVRGVVLFPGWFVEPMTRAWKKAGLSAGRGNAQAVARAVRTKIKNGTAARMSTATAIQGAIGGQTADAYKTAAGAAADVAKTKMCELKRVSAC